MWTKGFLTFIPGVSITSGVYLYVLIDWNALHHENLSLFNWNLTLSGKSDEHSDELECDRHTVTMR
jgi:hypothetical protein